METNNTGYIPYGEEWKKEMKKLTKEFLIEMLKRAHLERQRLEERLIQKENEGSY